eukprot:Amastigsp_a346152_14.p5 type:complete len:106 gc:universal Amastigsp_a346152_14:567-250(-)
MQSVSFEILETRNSAILWSESVFAIIVCALCPTTCQTCRERYVFETTSAKEFARCDLADGIRSRRKLAIDHIPRSLLLAQSTRAFNKLFLGAMIAVPLRSGSPRL